MVETLRDGQDSNSNTEELIGDSLWWDVVEVVIP